MVRFASKGKSSTPDRCSEGSFNPPMWGWLTLASAGPEDKGFHLLHQRVVGLLTCLLEDAYDVVRRGKISSHNFGHTLKKMCKKGAYWGTVAGLYVGMEYGVENVRGRRDWKNAMIGGALTGAVISAATNNSRDKIVADTITGAAIATAAVFLNYLT